MSRYLNVGDLSIRDDLESVSSVSGLSDSEEETKNPRKVKDPTPAWVAAATWDRHTSLENTRSGSRRTTSAAAAAAKPGRDPRGERPLGVGGGPFLDAVERRALDSQRVSGCHPHTSEARDALRLQLGHGDQEEEEEKGETKKKRRRRKKREIRKRHVNQLLVRGENVVLISVMEP